ncbi:twin-arginine translocase subunit TatC [Mesonia mobilis]|jgi:sec-independent protein translocase protein TatC|uniref:Sec-independent protein translocase protein TatC n=1 Tax=Mesonia mobilis TaxID=369791 RepID=A0ABQ3BP73_9FLAO|nr:twin-arginine translocase subunit TatC [Mesonia mobilis]GGZ53191.1 Sec-independent protein translocase protein TatC [Mesonia mobilis]|tara:strand:+ start:768 stop:1616 length:849 start_codon:yes stop_codon:yes gene_type:complete
MAKRPKVNPNEMSFLDHLEELRWHLIRATLAVVVAGIFAFIAKEFIFDIVLLGPKQPDFITYQILCDVAKSVGLDESFCYTEIPFSIQNRTMSGQFSIHMWTAITAGFIIAFPYILYEFWRFIAPALHENERKASRGFIIIASLLFFIGVLFGYYVISPLSINFLGSYQVSEEVVNEIDLSSYMGLIRASALASGIVFELPIIIFLLTKIGLVTPQILKQYRKFALVGILIVSAIITPPDIASQIVVAIPVLILYEISIFISRMVLKKERKEKIEEKSITKN